MSQRLRYLRSAFLLFFLIYGIESFSQGLLYTARGYWEESTKASYRTIKQKLEKGDSLTENESNYLHDYEAYLATYFLRMPDVEKQDYERLKAHWDNELTPASIAIASENREFEWRGHDRLSNGFYGLYYGIALADLVQVQNAGAAGIPLITAGLWMLGPAINPTKYEGITRNTVRAGNTGKLLGLGYGAAFALMVAGNSESSGKWVLGLSSVGSIVMGETAFQLEKTKRLSAGHIELMRHYGFLGPGVGLSAFVSSRSESSNLAGAAMVGGGIAGLIIGNQVAKRYDYTRGDVDAISSLTIISTGLGFTAVVGSWSTSNNTNSSLILIPAASAILATAWGQQSVRGAHLTDRQGSTINLSTAGMALLGLGIVALTETNSAAVWIGVPSGLAFITHQALLHNYKMKNLEMNLHSGRYRKNNYRLALNVTPESYFLNKSIPVKDYSPQTFSKLQNPLVKLTFTF